MESPESYEAKLLRVLIGFLHVSLSQQLALTRYGKPFHTLTPEEKTILQDQMLIDVMTLARQVTPEALKKFLEPPPHDPSMIH